MESIQHQQIQERAIEVSELGGLPHFVNFG